MNVRIKALVLGICLLNGAAFGREGIASFAKQSLGVDLASIPFGKAVQMNREYGIISPPSYLTNSVRLTRDDRVSWMTNAASVKYNRDFPNRFLRFGFRDGKLVAIQISISTVAGDFAVIDPNEFGTSDQKSAHLKLHQQCRLQLLQIRSELKKASAGHIFDFGDDSFRLQYDETCDGGPSLFLTETQITPIEKKTAL